MTWKLNSFGKTRSGVTGVPWRELSDEEYERYTAEVGDLSAYFEAEGPKPGLPGGPEASEHQPGRERPPTHGHRATRRKP